MKNILFTVTLLLTLWSCNPINLRDSYSTGTAKIKAEVINPKTTITLGDSVAFYFEFPDSVELNGNKIKITAGSIDDGNLGPNVGKIIPSLPGGFSIAPSLNTCNIWANPGKIGPTHNLVFANLNGKLLGKFYIIPQQKGVYFFELSQEGYADLNNQSLKLRFSFNFGNINRNHQMLIDSAGAANNFNLFLQGKISQGLEVYGFKVN